MRKYIHRVAWIGLILVYLVVLAGSVVRMSGSGMGCPDWPKCFGQWIPPTDESELPEDYQQQYTKKRIEKAKNFAKTLEKVGFKHEAEKLRNSELTHELEKPFNATKTWVEYLNRLVGFLAGNFFLLSVILALFYIKKQPSLFILSFINLVIIGFQAWFGSIVVATNLLPWTITVHMFLALLIIAIHILLVQKSSKANNTFKVQGINIKALFMFATVLTIIQIFLGTQVRQDVDLMLSNGISRAEATEEFDAVFYVHRTLSLLILAINGYLFYKFRKRFNIILKWILAIIVAEISLGVIMYYVAIPPWTQPLHLLLATSMFGLQVYWLLAQLPLNKKKKLAT